MKKEAEEKLKIKDRANELANQLVATVFPPKNIKESLKLHYALFHLN